MGLLEPHGRHRRRHGQTDLNPLAGPQPRGPAVPLPAWGPGRARPAGVPRSGAKDALPLGAFPARRPGGSPTARARRQERRGSPPDRAPRRPPEGPVPFATGPARGRRPEQQRADSRWRQCFVVILPEAARFPGDRWIGPEPSAGGAPPVSSDSCHSSRIGRGKPNQSPSPEGMSGGEARDGASQGHKAARLSRGPRRKSSRPRAGPDQLAGAASAGAAAPAPPGLRLTR